MGDCFVFIYVGLKLLGSNVNVSVLRLVELMLKNAFKISFFIEKTRLCDFNKGLFIFNSKKQVFEPDFIVSEQR